MILRSPLPRGARRTCQRRGNFTYMDPLDLFFQLATPNSAHWCMCDCAGASQRCMKSWHWVHMAPAGRVHPICASFHSFKAARQTIGRTRLKLRGLIAAMDKHVPLWLRVLSGTSSTCQRRKLYKLGILRACEILS